MFGVRGGWAERGVEAGAIHLEGLHIRARIMEAAGQRKAPLVLLVELSENDNTVVLITFFSEFNHRFNVSYYR